MIGIDLEIKNNQYTNRMLGAPSYREGKVACLQEWLTRQPQAFDSLHFYSDSINDLALLEHVDHPHVVNPGIELAKKVQLHNWPVYHWQL